MSPIKLSIVVPVKSKDDTKLPELLRSIDAQDFPKDEMEVLLITEGTSESAKAIGIRKAKGDVVCILASDNVLEDKYFLHIGYEVAMKHWASQPTRYLRRPNDNSLNRYYALIGGNDPLSYYMNKNDKLSYLEDIRDMDLHNKTTGDNGYFVQRLSILATNMDNYFHIDNSQQTVVPTNSLNSIVHNTSDGLIDSMRKRYCYGLQHAFNPNRRWHLVDFSKPNDVWRFLCFIIATITVIPTLFLSIRGYLRIKDVAWFMHPIVCLATLFTYGLLVIHLGVRRLFQSLSAPMVARRA